MFNRGGGRRLASPTGVMGTVQMKMWGSLLKNYLKSQYLGGRGKRIKSSRPIWAIIVGPCLQNQNKQEHHGEFKDGGSRARAGREAGPGEPIQICLVKNSRTENGH
jgi:hypothetical protein